MLYDFLSVGDSRWKVHTGVDDMLHPWRVDLGTRQLLRADTHEEELPESAWPTHPGDEWHGLVGTTRTVVEGWTPMPLTLEMEGVRDGDGLRRVFCFVDGYLAAIRAPGGENDLPEEREESPSSSAQAVVAGSEDLARIAAGDFQ